MYMTLENGTPQRGVLTPRLFNIVMNVLAKLPYPDGTQHVSYADDIALQTSGKNSAAKMQEALNALTTKCEEIGFTISQTKTKAMAKTRSIHPNKLQIQGRNIEWVATKDHIQKGSLVCTQLPCCQQFFPCYCLICVVLLPL